MEAAVSHIQVKAAAAVADAEVGHFVIKEHAAVNRGSSSRTITASLEVVSAGALVALAATQVLAGLADLAEASEASEAAAEVD